MYDDIKYIAIDPGETNGIAIYDDRYSLKLLQCIPYKELKPFLDQFTGIKICLCEDYIVYEHKAQAHTGSRLTTARAIGRVESWAEDNKVKLIKQAAQYYSLGFRFMEKRKPPRSDPLSHAKVAHAHFVYWAVKTGRINPKEFVKK
jgi:hypothetical protein